MNQTTELNIFFAYARKDQSLRSRLDVHLSGMKRKNYVKTWFDGKIEAGQEWEPEIQKALDASDIILLLLSPDFIASDYCYNVEMEKAIERHEKGEATIIPIILSHCDWKETPLSKIQALPKDALPVLDKKWYTEDEALYSVALGIKSIVNRVVEEREKKFIDYYTHIDELKSEVEQLTTRIEHLREAETSLIKKNEDFRELREYEDLVRQQKNIIIELRQQLNSYQNVPVNDFVKSVVKAKVINPGWTYSTINQVSDYDNLWINSEVKEKSGESEWRKTGFSPQVGMIGEIINSFKHSHSDETVFVLKIDDQHYLPIGQKGIEMIE